MSERVSDISYLSTTPVKLSFPLIIEPLKSITPQKTTGVPGNIRSLLSRRNLNASVSAEMIASKCLSLYLWRYSSLKLWSLALSGSILFVSMYSISTDAEGIAISSESLISEIIESSQDMPGL